MQALGRVRQQVVVLVHGAALRRHRGPERGERLLEPSRPVDDKEIRRPQATRDEVVENGASGSLALAAGAPTPEITPISNSCRLRDTTRDERCTR